MNVLNNQHAYVIDAIMFKSQMFKPDYISQQQFTLHW